ncbi:PGAP2-interacting protein isoform X1 [Lingula anatina]|uniref:PGAP2-interacting protein n=1 Tax=Lingula anatina TaxID=7574 RepID=A0A1S3KFU0_LINAN|nr:PGAP2-interacting protein isoform X2 [Lingula anatina]XP_023932770.1 PGAP2-interacting protein isoform X1 [Lingula anatina]|eukprot:XP_013421096.1 PGAP2-interacting protein isoform X2 [Lingula anatina]
MDADFTQLRSTPSKIKTEKEHIENGQSVKTGCNIINIRSVIRESVLGYVFWSLFQGLGPMIWFYPLNELEISGYEVFCLLWLSPIVTCISPIFHLIQHPWVLGGLRLFMVGCIASFQAPTTLQRLILLALGNGAAMLVLVATLWKDSTYQRYLTFWGLMVGFFAVLAGRIWFTSFIPTWWDNPTNSAVLAVGLIATVDKIMSGGDSLPVQKISSPRPYWLSTGVGFGSLLYLTHWIFGEVSIATRWVVTGYPDHGPQPNPWGASILISLAFGILVCCRFSASKIWWIDGALSLVGLYYLPTWQGFACANLLAIYTMSIWPEMIDRLSRCPAGPTLTLSVVTYLVEIFFSVWTVAYNFVPGGEFTREHTDYLIGFMVVCLGLGLFTSSSVKVPGHTAFSLKKPNGTVKGALLCMVLLGLGGFLSRQDPNRYNHPVKYSPKTFRAAIWTYHFGYDNKGWPSLERSFQLLNDTGADFITLLESDASKPFLGNNDLGMWLGERLGMYVDFGPATKDHTWGNLILSKYPIVKSKHHLLPSPHGELAPGITATVNYSGSLVDFVVTHMGNDRDVLDRELQAKFLANELKNSKNPAVFLGYVTSSPGSRDYYQFINQGQVKDIDATDRERWCEYIMYKKLIRLGYARVSHGGLSDTELQMATFQIPEDTDHYKDNDKYVTDPNKVDEKHRFNERFGRYTVGHNWIEEHRFHMSTPKYFIHREGS